MVWKKGQKGQWGGAEGIKKWQKVVGTHDIYIYWDSKLLVPVVYFADPV